MVKKILLCFDGSGQSPERQERDRKGGKDKDISNILKLHLRAGGSIDNSQEYINGQVSIYIRGVGELEANPMNKVKVNGTGLNYLLGDLQYQISAMEERLRDVYEEGDLLYLFGFSRGAAAARIYSSHLHKHGLDLTNGARIDNLPIEFLGCFDTVSTQVVKNMWSPFQLLWEKVFKTIPSCKELGEDGTIAPNVRRAVHCVSLDDPRMYNGFSPTLMSQDDRVHEAWFPGIHGDTGGGFHNDGLSDETLEYMMDWLSSLGENKITFIQGHPAESALLNPQDADGKLEISDDFFELHPTPTGQDHTADVGVNEPSYRPLYVALNDERVDGATVNVHVSVYKRMAALKDSMTPYVPNPLLTDCSFQVVGPLCKALEVETEEFRNLLATVGVVAKKDQIIGRRMRHVCTC